MIAKRMRLFMGTAHPEFARKLGEHLGLTPDPSEAFHFTDGNLFVKIGVNVRGYEVFLVQTLSPSVNDHLMELVFLIDACKRASSGPVTAVIPYYSYALADKKDEPRVSIRGRLVADLLETAGVDRVLTMDLHSPQIQGFFRKPWIILRDAGAGRRARANLIWCRVTVSLPALCALLIAGCDKVRRGRNAPRC